MKKQIKNGLVLITSLALAAGSVTSIVNVKADNGSGTNFNDLAQEYIRKLQERSNQPAASIEPMSLDPVNLETDPTSSLSDTDDIETTDTSSVEEESSRDTSSASADLAAGADRENKDQEDTEYIKAVTMYRLYNPHSGEHFYTSSVGEKNAIVKAGWKDEGIGWYAPSEGDPVYRLYNKNGGEHHYTIKKSERDMLVKAGWKNEGIGWYSDKSKSVPLYRQYNPNAYANNHNYTTNKKESQMLISLGWKDEGIAWYGVSAKLIGQKRPPLISVDADQNHPHNYYVDGTPDKIGFSSEMPEGDDHEVYISVNGNLKLYQFEEPDNMHYFDGDYALYATDIDLNDGYKNLILVSTGDDGIQCFYIFAYKGNNVLLLGHTRVYEETAGIYMNLQNTIKGDGRLYLMNSLRFYADPDGQPCFRSYVYVNGTQMESHEDDIEIYHRLRGHEKEFASGCRLALAENTVCVDDDGTHHTFTKGAVVNVVGYRYDEDEIKIQFGGRAGWIKEGFSTFKNYFGFA